MCESSSEEACSFCWPIFRWFTKQNCCLLQRCYKESRVLFTRRRKIFPAVLFWFNIFVHQIFVWEWKQNSRTWVIFHDFCFVVVCILYSIIFISVVVSPESAQCLRLIKRNFSNILKCLDFDASLEEADFVTKEVLCK